MPHSLKAEILLLVLLIGMGFPMGLEATRTPSGAISPASQVMPNPLVDYVMPARSTRFLNPMPNLPVGNGSINIAFDASFPANETAYVNNLFDTVYPELKKFYGFPSNNITVYVKYNSTLGNVDLYDPEIDSMTFGVLPHPDGAVNDQVWDSAFTHELAHAFHDAVFICSCWVEEGMAEAANELADMDLLSHGGRNITFRAPWSNLLVYDPANSVGNDTLGGTMVGVHRVLPDLFYRVAPALFLILTAQLSENASNPYDFLARLNRQIYINASGPLGPDFAIHRFESILAEVADSRTVDGLPVLKWLSRQPITLTQGTAGPHLGVIMTPSDNVLRLIVWAYDRVVSPDPMLTYERPLSDLAVDVQLYSSGGMVVYSGALTTNSAGYVNASLPSFPLRRGGYAVTASATVNDVQLTSRSFGVSLGTSTLPSGNGAKIYGVTLDGAGIPVQAYIASNTTMIWAENSGFALNINSPGLPRLVAVEGVYLNFTLGKMVGVPIPYARVVALSFTGAPMPVFAELVPLAVSLGVLVFLTQRIAKKYGRRTHDGQRHGPRNSGILVSGEE